MPVGNIDPQTDNFTRSSVLLGDEEYPSAVQQALARNGGWLMYRERSAHQYHTGTVLPNGTQEVRAGLLYVEGGKYDVNVHVIANCQASANTSYVWLQLGTTMASSVGTIPFIAGTLDTTFTETFEGVTIPSGWYSLRAYTFGAADTGLVSAHSVLRQYEEA